MTKLNVNIELMTLGDLEVMENWTRGDARITDVLTVFEKILDVDPRTLPLTSLTDIVNAITNSITEAQNPKN